MSWLKHGHNTFCIKQVVPLMSWNPRHSILSHFFICLPSFLKVTFFWELHPVMLRITLGYTLRIIPGGACAILTRNKSVSAACEESALSAMLAFWFLILFVCQHIIIELKSKKKHKTPLLSSSFSGLIWTFRLSILLWSSFWKRYIIPPQNLGHEGPLKKKLKYTGSLEGIGSWENLRICLYWWSRVPWMNSTGHWTMFRKNILSYSLFFIRMSKNKNKTNLPDVSLPFSCIWYICII